MPAPATRHPLTVADYRQLPPAGPYFQLIEGKLVKVPSPRKSHQNIGTAIFMALLAYVKNGHPCALKTTPFEVYLDDRNVYRPDILLVSAPRESLVLRADAVHGAPDLVVEVLSPSNTRAEKDLKRRAYARAGVAEMWLADSDLRTLEVFRFAENQDRPVMDLAQGDTLTTPLLPGLALNIDTVFGV